MANFDDRGERIGILASLRKAQYSLSKMKHINKAGIVKDIASAQKFPVVAIEWSTSLDAFGVSIYKLTKDASKTPLSIPSLCRKYGKISPFTADELKLIGGTRGEWIGHNVSFDPATVLLKYAGSAVNMHAVMGQAYKFYYDLEVELKLPAIISFQDMNMDMMLFDNAALQAIVQLTSAEGKGALGIHVTPRA